MGPKYVPYTRDNSLEPVAGSLYTLHADIIIHWRGIHNKGARLLYILLALLLVLLLLLLLLVLMVAAPFCVSQLKRVIPFCSLSYQQKVAGVTMCRSRDSCREEDNSKNPNFWGI